MASSMGDRAVVLPLDDPDASVAAIRALHARSPIDAIVAVDDGGTLIAAMASAALGFAHNPTDAIVTTRDKLAMRRAFAAADVPQPRFAPDDAIGFPCVVKPIGLSASRGVIRVDDPDRARSDDRSRCRYRRRSGDHRGVRTGDRGRARRSARRRSAADPGGVRQARPARRAVLRGDDLRHAVAPRRPRRSTRSARSRPTRPRRSGLREGPVHAEFRLTPEGRIATLELAARSIGGLCARTLRFGAGIALEEVILRHALGLALDDLAREPAAAGVMMLPIPRAARSSRWRGSTRLEPFPASWASSSPCAPDGPWFRSPRAIATSASCSHGETPEMVEARCEQPPSSSISSSGEDPPGLGV